jgi:hypothetical protein
MAPSYGGGGPGKPRGIGVGVWPAARQDTPGEALTVGAGALEGMALAASGALSLRISEHLAMQLAVADWSDGRSGWPMAIARRCSSWGRWTCVVCVVAIGLLHRGDRIGQSGVAGGDPEGGQGFGFAAPAAERGGESGESQHADGYTVMDVWCAGV